MTQNHSNSIGYKQPPKAHQFRPGESGNPSGRTKGVRNFKSDLRDELAEMTSFCEGGHEVSISKQRAVIKRLVAYSEAGSDCLYAPGFKERDHIKAIVEAVAPKPVNVLIGGAGGLTMRDAAELGAR